MQLKLSRLIRCIALLDKSDYSEWNDDRVAAANQYNAAMRLAGDAFDDIRKARMGTLYETKERTYKPICDRLRAMGYEIINDNTQENTEEKK